MLNAYEIQKHLSSALKKKKKTFYVMWRNKYENVFEHKSISNLTMVTRKKKKYALLQWFQWSKNHLHESECNTTSSQLLFFPVCVENIYKPFTTVLIRY